MNPFDNGSKTILGNDGADLMRVASPRRPKLELPFRPFTLAEVQAITGCRSDIIDSWAERMGIRRGSSLEGLEYNQCFGVYVGWRFLEEGAPPWRATEAAEYVALMSDKFITEQIAAGNTFVVTRGCFPKDAGVRAGMLVKAPDNRLGKTLNLKVLLEEFGYRMKRTFPNG